MLEASKVKVAFAFAIIISFSLNFVGLQKSKKKVTTCNDNSSEITIKMEHKNGHLKKILHK